MALVANFLYYIIVGVVFKMRMVRNLEYRHPNRWVCTRPSRGVSVRVSGYEDNKSFVHFGDFMQIRDFPATGELIRKEVWSVDNVTKSC